MSLPISSGDASSSSVVTRNEIPEYLNNVPFPPRHLNLKQILKSKPHRRKSKNTDAEKRTINSFLLYRKECSEHLKDKKIDIRQKELSRLIAISWSLQPEFVKDHYKNLADEAKQLHKKISPQIQIRLYNPNSKSSNSSEEENKDDKTDSDENNSPNSPQIITNENGSFVENDWFADIHNDSFFPQLAQNDKISDSSLFQSELCNFCNSSLTYSQNLYFYHLLKYCYCFNNMQ